MRSASCSCHGFSEPCRRPSVLWEPVRRAVSWKCASRSRPRTPIVGRRSGKPASATSPLPPPRVRGGYLCLFLIGQGPPGRPSMARLTVEAETTKPVCSSKASRCSSRVRSLLSCKLEGNHSWSAAPLRRGRPGIGFGSTFPVSRRLLREAFNGGHRHREGLCDFFPWHCAVDASEHPQS